MDLFGRKRERAAEIERLLDADLDAGVDRLSAERRKLRRQDAERLEAIARQRLDAREHRTFLSKSLADGAIAPSAALELLETYVDAGFVTPSQREMLYRHAFEAHRREILALLEDPNADRFSYFRLLDGYRAAGYLSEDELVELESLLDIKLNPAMAARRLFAQAQTAEEAAEQEELLYRYLMEYVGFPEYPQAASHYVALKVHELWEALPGVKFARDATRLVHELNNVLKTYLRFTADISATVPIDRMVNECFSRASDFRPQPDVERPITERHLNRQVIVVEKNDGEPGSYKTERNSFVSIGAKGRVRAVRGDLVVVSHQTRNFPYTQEWAFEGLRGTRHHKLAPHSNLAVWHQLEVGLVQQKQPSPVFVHQYKEAVHEMAELLGRHREDRSPPPDGPKLLEGRSGKAF